jgi:hypothetical protein
MSAPPSSPPLPDAWVRRLFERFAEVYGAQKATAMWSDVGMDRLVPVWAEALARFDASTLAAAVRALPERESMWPPTLPEMVALCREQREPAIHRRALPPPSRTRTDIAVGREKLDAMLAAIGKPERGDRAAWAYRVIERYKAGDGMSHCSYKFAVEALQNLGRLPRESAPEAREVDA